MERILRRNKHCVLPSGHIFENFNVDNEVVVYVGNLSCSVMEDNLRKMFEEFGVVKMVRFSSRPKSEGSGLVRMNKSDGMTAISILQRLVKVEASQLESALERLTVKVEVSQLDKKVLQYWIDIETSQRSSRACYKYDSGFYLRKRQKFQYLFGPSEPITTEEAELGKRALKHLVNQYRLIKVEVSRRGEMKPPPK